MNELAVLALRAEEAENELIEAAMQAIKKECNRTDLKDWEFPISIKSLVVSYRSNRHDRALEVEMSFIEIPDKKDAKIKAAGRIGGELLNLGLPSDMVKVLVYPRREKNDRKWLAR